MLATTRFVRISPHRLRRMPAPRPLLWRPGACLACGRALSSTARLRGQHVPDTNRPKRTEKASFGHEDPYAAEQRRLVAAYEANQRQQYQQYQQPPPSMLQQASSAASSPQSKRFVTLVVLSAVAFYLLSSQQVPLTGRRRFNFLSEELVARMYPRATSDVMSMVYEQGSHVMPDDHPSTIVVKKVMRKLIPVSGLADWDWKIWVIADDCKFSEERKMNLR